jgi:hypothetical protein
MKLKITIIAEYPIETPIDKDAWPKCKTIKDVAKLQQKYLDEGDMNPVDFLDLCNNHSIKIEGIE